MDVESVPNGLLNLESFKARAFDIVIMDCQMPEMDGYEATQAIREFDTKTPIIAITADAIKGAKEKCLEVGMNDYLTKPIDQAKLMKTLAQYLEPVEGEIETPVAEPQTANEEVPLNLEHLAMFTDGDPNEEKQLLDLFFEQSDIGVNELEEFLAANDNEGWKKSAHRMKGAAANLGAIPLSNACKTAEEGAQASNAEKADMLANIQKHISSIQLFIQEKN